MKDCSSKTYPKYYSSSKKMRSILIREFIKKANMAIKEMFKRNEYSYYLFMIIGLSLRLSN